MRRACKGSVVVGIGLLAGVAYGQVGVIFSLTDSRPLAKAAEEFEARYGIPISYEDPAYAYNGDLIDHTDPDYKRSHPGGFRALDPKVGTVVLRGNFRALVRSSADAMAMLQSLLDDHLRAGNAGEFALISNGDGVAIVPARVRNANGVLSPDQSPLETRISLPELRRTATQTLDAIGGAIRTNSGKEVGVASSPFIGMQPYSVTIGANNEAARGVLQRTLAGLEYADGRTVGHIPKMAWSLLYVPGQKIYLLNVRQVLVEAPVFR
jgi:hypothetical protein